MRSPEVVTPSHRSPVRREKFDAAETVVIPIPVVVDEAPSVRVTPDVMPQPSLRVGQDASTLSPRKGLVESVNAKAVRDKQPPELLQSLGMTTSSSSSSSGSKNIRHDGDLSSDRAIAQLVAADAMMLDHGVDSTHDLQVQKMKDAFDDRSYAAMRVEMEKAQKAEKRCE